MAAATAAAAKKRGKRRARPGSSAAIHHSAKLISGDWLGILKQTLGCKIEGGEGGESLPTAPKDQLLNACDGQLYFIGAVGKSSLGKVSARAVPPEKAGTLLHACEQLWKEMQFNKINQAEYGRLYHLTHTTTGRGDFSVCWCFSSVVLLCMDAKTRNAVLPALKGVVCLFAVVLTGDAFVTEGECTTAWKAGTGNVYCACSPDTPLRVEVEGSTSLVLAYMVESDVGQGVPQAKKRAACFAKAKLAAREDWDSLLKNSRAKRRRREAAREGAAQPELLMGDSAQSAGTTSTGRTLTLEPPQGFSSMLCPWHEGGRLVHRLIVGCRGLSDNTKLRWAQSLRSWREPWLQIVWVYEAADLDLLGVEPHARLLVRNANIVMPATELAEWRARTFPIPLIKDLFQLQCLHMFGGWWADMDYFMLQQEPPSTEGKSWLLGTEYERSTSSYRKNADGTMMLGDLLVSVNLGIMWAKQSEPLLLEAQHKARALWKGKDKEWSGLRTQSGYLSHQRMIQDLFARTNKADCMVPILTSPFPRWGPKWEAQLGGREGAEFYGVVLPAECSILTRSFTCNVWDGCWQMKASDGLALWVETKQILAPGPGASPGASGSEAMPRAPGSGASPSGPPAKMLDAAALVIMALPRLIESGVPATIALRAMAAALQAIGRGGNLRCSSAAAWPAEHVAFGFLSGALKSEWVRPGEEATSCISNLEGSRGALAERFGLTREFHKGNALAFDMMYCDGDYVDLPVEY